jgi:HSP20 family protein
MKETTMNKTPASIAIKREPAPPAGGTREMAWPFAALRSEIEQLFDDFDIADWRLPLWRRAGRAEAWRPTGEAAMLCPAMDLVERGDAYEIEAEIPGIAPEEVELKLSDGWLAIRGEKTTERDEAEGDYHLRERSFGRFERRFRLPPGVDSNRIEARMASGVLNVRLPKTAEAKASEKTITVKAA